nr:hypothetical protein [Sphingomonas sp.]
MSNTVGAGVGTSSIELVGNDSDETLDGTAGDDVLIGAGGADTLNGGDGSDALFSGNFSPFWQPYYSGVTPVLDRGTEVDTLNGGAGFDYLFAGYGDNVDGGTDGAALTISFAGGATGVSADFRQFDSGGTLTIGGGLISNITTVRWVEGTNFDDTIYGANSIYTLTWNTTIFAMGGNDRVVAGAATGDIHGGDGNDVIESAYSNGLSTYYGDDGDDIITVTNSISSIVVEGGTGNDTLTLAGLAYGGAGNDLISASVNSNYGLAATGDDGDDVLNGGNFIPSSTVLFSDSLWGGAGADTIHGNGGDDILMTAGAARQFPYSATDWERSDFGTERDVVTGDAGNDTIYAGYGDDVDGGTGTNSLWLSLAGASAGMTLNAATLETGGSVQIGGGTIVNIQQVFGLFGSNFADVLTLSRSGTLQGLDGDDTLNGSSATDQLYGGAGSDIINAGGGNDTIYIQSQGEVGSGEQINGGDGADTLFVGSSDTNAFADRISLTGVTFTGVETLSQTTRVGYVGITREQIAGFSTILANLYFLESGAISLAGKTGYGGNGFDLNPGGNELDLRGFITTNDPNFGVRGGESADSVFAGAGYINFAGGGGNDTLYAGGGGSNFTGGAGNDTLVTGSGANGDILNGGAGADTLIGTAATLNNDWFADFSVGDRIVITDANLATFSFGFSNDGKLNFTGGSITLGIDRGNTSIVVSAAAEGGVQLTAVPHEFRNDANGDFRSDIILRDAASGWLTDWLGTETGALTNNGANASLFFSADWKVVGTGDYDGDNRYDLLLRNDAGWLTNWLGRANGGFANNGSSTSLYFTPDWKVAGNGDFNGDGKADLLLRRDDGWLTNWLGNWQGAFDNNGANISLFFTTDWKIASTGDFNGDGYTDILLRRDDGWVTNWLGNSSGGFTNNGANTALFFTLDWKVVGTGDVNGDGKDDLILRRDDGWITDWLATDNGGFVNNGANTALYLTTDWTISSIADFNGDGREDILLRHESGWLTDWLGTTTGSFANNGANFSTFIAPNWVVQDPFM